jgi:hypothetical protein
MQRGLGCNVEQIYLVCYTNDEWDIIRDKAERIIGVRSQSEKGPLKKSNFPEEYKTFEAKTKCSAWEFVNRPIIGRK